MGKHGREPFLVRIFFGNRRLKSWLYTLFKFFVITYLQSREVLSDDLKKIPVIHALTTTVGYFWMVTLFLLFTVRYFREVHAVRTKKPLNITINRIEVAIFAVYVFYSFMTATLHCMSIVQHVEHQYAEDPELEEEEPKSLKIFVEILEVLIHLYIILEKLTHFMHANHSVSLYLESPKPVPNPHAKENLADDDHDHDHDATSEYRLMPTSSFRSNQTSASPTRKRSTAVSSSPPQALGQPQSDDVAL